MKNNLPPPYTARKANHGGHCPADIQNLLVLPLTKQRVDEQHLHTMGKVNVTSCATTSSREKGVNKLTIP